MTAVAVICEYNPFHTGHAYHLNEAKRISGADFVVGIMSGCFVQRAEPAIISPQIRAMTALLNGMDAVMELPVAFSASCGNIFAEGAVCIMSRIHYIKYLAIGAEDDGNTLQAIAKTQHEESDIYVDTLKNALDSGLSYPAAVTKATQSALPKIENCHDILTKPNNLLAIEYLKALRKFKSNIQPIFIKRQGNGYNDTCINGKYISATAARILIENNRYDELKPYIPPSCFDMLKNERENNPVDSSVYNALTVYALRTRDISQAADCAEGLDIKIRNCAIKYGSLSKILQESKSKRYTMSRIKRICLQNLLGITKNSLDYDNAKARLIAIKSACKSYIKHLTGVAVQNNDYTDAVGPDSTAGEIYSLITHRDGNIFWDRKLITL